MNFGQINRSILSPLIAFPAIWVIGALLSQIHILHSQYDWSTVMIGVVCAVPLGFIAGGVIGEAIASRATSLSVRRETIEGHLPTVRKLLAAMVAIGFLELLHQFARTGAVPLLSGNIDAARFGQGGPTLLLTNFLTIAIIIALTTPRDLLARESRFELGIAAIGLGGFALQAGRGTLILPIAVAIAARWIYWGRPPLSLLLGGGILGAMLVSLVFYKRAEQHPTTPFEAELFSEVLPGLPFFLKPLVALYLGVTTNFLALQGVIGHFPTVAPFAHGDFNALGVDVLVPTARDLGGISALLTPPWVTSTIAGPFWADGGFSLVIVGMVIVGALSAGAWAAARRTLSLRWSLVAAYFLYLAVFGVYTNLWTLHIDWLMIAPCLLVFGAVIENPESPPGATGRALSRISGRFKSPARPDRSGNGNRGLWKWVAGALAAIAALLVTGAIIEASLPEPYPRTETFALPPSVAEADAVMTESDHNSENSPLYWVNRKGDRITLGSFRPGSTPPETDFTQMRLPGGFENVQYDVGVWPPHPGTALFIFHQMPRTLEVLIKDTGDGHTIGRYRTHVGAPAPDLDLEYRVSTFGGGQPDVYLIYRGTENQRARVVTLSGESKFRQQNADIYLPVRGLDPPEWGVDFGPIAIADIDKIPDEDTKARADLVLVEHDPDKGSSIVRVMLGENSFQGFSFQRALEAPGDVGPGAQFFLAASHGATSLYMVRTDASGRSTLSVFPLQPEAGLY